MNIEDAINSISTESKDIFLLNSLNSNENLKKSFLEYVESCKNEAGKQDLSFDSFTELVKESREGWKEDLENLNLEPDWEFYTPRHSGYIEEWEAALHMAEDEIETVFSSWRDAIFDMILEQKINESVIELIGMYEACLISKVEDEYDNFDPINDHFIEVHEKTLKEFVLKIGKSVIPVYKLNKAHVLLSEYLKSDFGDVKLHNKYFENLLNEL